ncbi:hypothetical protein B0H13DRAFT_2326900 [Mycena leptocephala]|nr:hypothetical protein B0H13DRAFT_2326900 [Mycena leptocephala]
MQWIGFLPGQSFSVTLVPLTFTHPLPIPVRGRHSWGISYPLRLTTFPSRCRSTHHLRLHFLQFYRASTFDMKRIVSMLRFPQTRGPIFILTSVIPTIRSYGEIKRFIRDNIYYIDLENRALPLTVPNQRYGTSS